MCVCVKMNRHPITISIKNGFEANRKCWSVVRSERSSFFAPTCSSAPCQVLSLGGPWPLFSPRFGPEKKAAFCLRT